MANVQKKRTFLASILEKETGLVYGKDYVFKDVQNKTETRQDPKEFVIIHFLKNTKVYTEIVQQELKKIGLDVQSSYRFYVRLPQLNSFTSLSLSPEKVTDFKHAEEFDLYRKCLVNLKDLHERLTLLGTPNNDQRQLSDGIVSFNYFDETETSRAFDIFASLGLYQEKRTDKKCNLNFLLTQDFIDTSKTIVKKREFNGKTIDACIWVIKKIFRKTFENFPVDKAGLGASERCRIVCDKIDMLQIKNDLEKHYGIIVVLFPKVSSDSMTKSEFIILTNEKTKEIYKNHKGKISPCDIFKNLENKTLNPPKPMAEKTLLSNTRNVLQNAGYLFFQNRKEKGELCIEMRCVDENSTKISAIGGENIEEKMALIKAIKSSLLEANPDIKFVDGDKLTNITISIPGMKNVPQKRHDHKKSEPISTAPKMEKLIEPEFIVPVISEEQELKNLLNEPLLEEEIRQEILAFFQKEDINKRARSLLAQLKAK